MTWNGAGGWVIVSQDRQVNFSRTVWITFHCRGTTSSVSVMSSPSLASLPPQQGQALGAGITTRSRGRCAGNGARTGLLAGEAAHRRWRPQRRSVGCASSSVAVASSSSSCSSSWSSSLRPRSAEAPNCSRFSLAISSFRCATIASAPGGAGLGLLPRRALGQRAPPAARRCRRAGSRRGVTSRLIASQRQSRAQPPIRVSQTRRSDQPASSGRQVRSGFRQSIPSSM